MASPVSNIILTAFTILGLVFLWGYAAPMGPQSVTETEAVVFEYYGDEFEVELPSSYVQFPVPRIGLPMRVNTFIVEDCAAQSIADYAAAKYHGEMDVLKACVVMSIVQANLHYISDPCCDHWKYPWETVRDGGGDCEDFAILICSVLRCMGVESVIAIAQNHAMVGIPAEPGVFENTISYLGKEYVIIDPTESGDTSSDVYFVLGYDLGIWNWVEILVYVGLVLLCLYGLSKGRKRCTLNAIALDAEHGSARTAWSSRTAM